MSLYSIILSVIIVAMTLIPIEAPQEQENIDQLDLLYPALDVSTGSVKARPSDMYHDVWEELGYTGKGINIAVLDTGVDDGHETFNGRWVAGVEITNPMDPRDGTNNPDDRNGHGTRVAGCLLGTGGNDGIYRGIAPDAGLVEVKVANDLLAGFSTNEYLMDGIQWCIDHKNDDWGDDDPANDGIDILSISYANQDSDDGSSDLAQRVDAAVDAGLIVIVAIGNEGPDNDGFGPPSSADKAITVGGIDDNNTVDRSDDVIWEGSSRGPREDDGDDDQYDELKPEIVAPAVGITSAQFSLTDQNGQGWDTQDGTSYATPHISGIAALMLEANPDLTQYDIDRIMRETAEARGEPDFPDLSEKYNASYGFGIVDAYECVSTVLGITIDQKGLSCTIDHPVNGSTVSGTVNISGSSWSSQGTVDAVHLRIGGEDWVPVNGQENWSYQWDTEMWTDGSCSIQARTSSGDTWSMSGIVNVTISNNGEDNGNGGQNDEGESSDEGDDLVRFPSLILTFIALSFAGIFRKKAAVRV